MRKQIILFLLLSLFALSSQAQQSVCSKYLSLDDARAIFKQNAKKQLALEFGEAGVFVYKIEHEPIDDTLLRIESFAKYKKPGQKDLATMRLKSWVSRCGGATIIRGNTWLADGTLIVSRYDIKSLKGEGLSWGDPNAPLHFVVYVDSRCPHCHRLMTYARKLVDEGQIFLEVRQVAYLESVEESLQDTLLNETALVRGKGAKLGKAEYFEMLSGFANEDAIENKDEFYNKAKIIVDDNTKTAFDDLHIISVPGVLMREKQHAGQYRILGYWEMNRIFQPNL